MTARENIKITYTIYLEFYSLQPFDKNILLEIKILAEASIPISSLMANLNVLSSG